MIETINLKPTELENLERYKYRLYKNKVDYNLTWEDISILIFKYFNKKISVDYIRHEAYSYNQIVNIEIDKDDKYTKVLILNDLHLPYVRDDIYNIIKKHKYVNYIIIGGDLADCKSCSSFPDFNKPSYEEELIIVHDFISKVNEIINPEKTKIIAIRGNHEYRATREIMNMQEKNLQKMLNPDMLDMISKGFTYYDRNKDISYKPIKNFQYINDWFVRLFDNLVVAHPTDFSSVEGTMDLKVADYFLNEHIAESDDVIVYGHTHKSSQMYVNRRQGLYVIENGCLCKPMDYAKTGKLKYTPQNYCYTELKFIDGQKIDLNNIKVYHLK